MVGRKGSVQILQLITNIDRFELNCKKVKSLESGANVTKKLVRNLLIFVQGQSVCQNRREKLAKYKHSSLLQTLIKQSHKKFYTIGIRSQCYKKICPYFTHFCTKLECLLEQAGKAYQGQTLQLITNIDKLEP